MILIFLLYLLFTISLSQIEVNLQGNIWDSYLQNCLNCTFRVSKSEEKFIYINVRLQSENSEFHLFSQQLTAMSNISQEFEQGSTIDLISALENRLTRFLKIEKPKFPLYITILDLTERSQFKISIKASSEIQCDNNCSENGDCTVDGCVCQTDYIGNNCNQKAQEIYEQEEEQYYYVKEPQYFYLTLAPYIGQKIQLKLSIDDYENGAIIYIQKTEANIIPKTDEYNIDKDLVDKQILFDTRPIKIDIIVSDTINYNSRLVFIAESLNGNYNTIPTLLKVELTILSEVTTVSSLIIIIIVVSIVIAIILIIVAFCIFRNLRRRRLIEQGARLRQDIFYTKPIVQNEKIENFLCVDEKQINPDDQCSICLDNFINGKELNQTSCKHYFHKDCILAWAQKHQECPICRASLVTKQI